MPFRSQKWMTPLALASSLIVLAGLAAYSNSFQGPYIFDDEGSILNNLTIRHLWRLGTVLSPPNHGETVSGRPILNLSFAINYALSGFGVWSYHVANLLIHLLNGLLLLGILRRTFLLPPLQPRLGKAALLLASAIALLWVVHPLQTESVTYIVQRAESLAAMFYLLALYAVIRGSHSQQRATIWYIVAVVACWLGISTKEPAISIPVMVLLYDRTLLAGTFRQAWRQRWGLYLGMASSWIWSIILVIRTGLLTKTYAQELEVVDVWSYLGAQPGVILYYLRMVLWPYPICLDHCWPPANIAGAVVWPTLVLGLLLAATLWSLRRSACSQGALGLLGAWFFLILAPSSSVVPLVQVACEHRMYLPLAPALTLLVISVYLAGQRWLVRGRLAIGLSLVILAAIVLGVVTFDRNKEYRSDLLIWEDTVKRIPHNPLSHTNLGAVLLRQGRASEAIEHFEHALQIQPNYTLAHNNLGNALVELGRPAEAIEHFKSVLQIKPNYPAAQINWGCALLNLGRPMEAIEHFQEALRQNPDQADAQYNWGNALVQTGRFQESIEHYRQAVQLQPEYTAALDNWGNALLVVGRPSEAIERYEQALRIQPDRAETLLHLSVALEQMGRIREAIERGREAARLMPDNSQVHQQVAWLLATHESAEGGDGAEAVKLAEKASRLIGRKEIVYLDTLAAAYASAGRFDEAIAIAQSAQQLAKTTGQDSQAEKILQRLQLYRNQKPYRKK